MDLERFDRLTVSISTKLSRRMVAGVLGLSALTLPRLSAAKKHKKKKKVKFNDFDCVNVGNFCKNSGQCCSGICDGKKGKKKCKAHDQGTCQPGQISTPCGPADVSCVTSKGDADGSCFSTTGEAGYCASTGTCATCKKDADCELELGPGAACIPCAAECEQGTACVGIQTEI